VKKHLVANVNTSFPGLRDTLVKADAEGFQRQFTAFLREHLSLFIRPGPREKVYEGICFMLIFALFGNEYNLTMEQDAGHGRSDITAHPRSPHCPLALIFEIKSVSRHVRNKGKRSEKKNKHMEKELEKAKTEALAQIADRRYRERVPLDADEVHEFALVFCGKFCTVAVRTLLRNVTEDWEQVAEDSTVVSVDDAVMDEEGFTDEGEIVEDIDMDE
jgi:hypothetical protein